MCTPLAGKHPLQYYRQRDVRNEVMPKGNFQLKESPSSATMLHGARGVQIELAGSGALAMITQLRGRIDNMDAKRTQRHDVAGAYCGNNLRTGRFQTEHTYSMVEAGGLILQGADGGAGLFHQGGILLGNLIHQRNRAV